MMEYRDIIKDMILSEWKNRRANWLRMQAIRGQRKGHRRNKWTRRREK